MISKERQLRAYLVEDHPLMRESLSTLLRQELGFAICGETDNAMRAEQQILEKKPDLAILDISLNGASGFGLIAKLRNADPLLKIIVLSMHDEKLYAEHCIRKGANGYLMKRESSQHIVDAVRNVLAGKLAISDQILKVIVGKFLHGRKPESGALLSELSDREREVFNLLGQGLASRKIAENMNVSAKTVQAYFYRIKQKLQLSTATELLSAATRWHEDTTCL